MKSGLTQPPCKYICNLVIARRIMLHSMSVFCSMVWYQRFPVKVHGRHPSCAWWPKLKLHDWMYLLSGKHCVFTAFHYWNVCLGILSALFGCPLEGCSAVKLLMHLSLQYCKTSRDNWSFFWAVLGERINDIWWSVFHDYISCMTLVNQQNNFTGKFFNKITPETCNVILMLVYGCSVGVVQCNIW